MLRILTIAAIFLLAITAHAAQSQENQTTEIDKLGATCYSSREKNEFIFITFVLFNDERLGGYAKHNNGSVFRLKYLYPEYVDMTGAGNDTESHTYAEMMNNKMTGYYTYTWYRGDTPALEYHPKKKSQSYYLRLDLEASNSEIPGIACDWSKSSRLSEEQNN
ncbi:hypothetical protein [Aquitalea sp. LB_tupeE]|uniref:hypothetical protein n=1 Tax=Aquitalea sp. LB_tupeE TaxID=2748078 RepID=UPI0015BBDE0F|nr:hypothetical protein [Aquitalea sp. LB_tupeE]NWK78180.1 hypothetical protein [Aquitalea sp. LB_tupeE]